MILHLIWFSVLLIHFNPVRNKYEVWYIVVLIHYLWGIHMTILFQIIQRWIGKYEFYNHCILGLKKASIVWIVKPRTYSCSQYDFTFYLLSVLLIHFIPVRNKSDVSYIVVPIDYLRGIHITGMKWISKTDNKIKCKIILRTRVRSWFYD